MYRIAVQVHFYFEFTTATCAGLTMAIYRVSQEECARLRESIPYVKVYRYNPKHLYPKLNGYGDNGQSKSAVFLRFHVLHLFS
jgi:hypothetical protein